LSGFLLKKKRESDIFLFLWDLLYIIWFRYAWHDDMYDDKFNL